MEARIDFFLFVTLFTVDSTVGAQQMLNEQVSELILFANTGQKVWFLLASPINVSTSSIIKRSHCTSTTNISPE